MEKIIPHLWFDKQAVEAAKFYVSLLPDSKIESINSIKGTPSGDTDVVSFSLAGLGFMAISAGPIFKINPSISFFLNFDPSKDKDARKHLDAAWEKLAQGGKAMMPIGKYPFSERYGWIEDRFGVSWQLILSKPDGEERPFLVPSLLFTKGMAGKADEAIEFYLGVFKGSKRGITSRYGKGMEPDPENSINFADFSLGGAWFAAMDSARMHDFAFNEAVSLVIPCKDQAEIDYYWGKLSAVPAAEQCGWLKDKYGVSWQVWPIELGEMMTKGTPEQTESVTKAFLAMKKFDLRTLREAYNGKGPGLKTLK